MTVLDAYAIIGYLRAERCADEVATLLRSPATLCAANLTEVVDQLVRTFGHHPDDVQADVGLLVLAGVRVEPVSASIATAAGQLRATHYNREHCAISLADSLAAATALSMSVSLATSDPPLAHVVRAEGGTVHALPDSRGKRPQM